MIRLIRRLGSLDFDYIFGSILLFMVGGLIGLFSWTIAHYGMIDTPHPSPYVGLVFVPFVLWGMLLLLDWLIEKLVYFITKGDHAPSRVLYHYLSEGDSAYNDPFGAIACVLLCVYIVAPFILLMSFWFLVGLVGFSVVCVMLVYLARFVYTLMTMLARHESDSNAHKKVGGSD